jgi:uncharacterized protein YukE
MDTEKVHATAKVIQDYSMKFDEIVDDLAISSRKLNAGWDGGASDAFCSQLNSLKRQLEKKTWELSVLAQRLQHEIDEWEAADRTLKGESGKKTSVMFTSTAPTGATVTAGQVLGASTTNLGQLNWKEKFDLERRLAEQISEMEGKYHSEEGIKERNAQIEKEIEALEKERAEAQRKAGSFLNQIIPDFPLQADNEDGVPWRVKADDYEDQVKRCDEQLAALRAEKDYLSQYENLKQQHRELNDIFQNRLKDVDPKKYSSCALYAQNRRPDLGRTQHKDGSAYNYINVYKDTAFQINTGDDLTKKVGKGFAVVWEPGVAGGGEVHGHVAIVEEVGKDYVIVSHAGWRDGTITKIPISKLQKLWLIP